MNSLEYQAEIRLALGADASDTSLFSAAQVLWALNAGLKKIATEREWPWLFTIDTFDTVSGTDTILLPSNHSRTAYLTVDEYDLEETSPRELAGYRSDSGVSTYYAVEGANLRLSPNPDGVYAVEHAYFQHELALVLNTDAPLLPNAYSDWAVSAGAHKLAIRTNNTTRLATLQAEYDKWLNIAQDNVRRAAAPSRIRRTRESVWPEWAS